MALSARPWLSAAYRVALVVHVLLIVLTFLGVAVMMGMASGINAAREGLILTAIFLVNATLMSAIPIVALLSWWLCRRRGWEPSTGHKALVLAGLAPYVLLYLGTVLR